MTGHGCYVSKESMEENMPPGHRPSYLCIEDPLVPGNDVGKSSYGAIQVQQAFDWAYSQLCRAVRKNCSVTTTLSRIVQVDEETINYRDWIRLNHPLQTEEGEEEEEEEEEERLNPDSDQASSDSCRSSSPEVEHQISGPEPEEAEDCRDCLEESGSSPGTGRSSPGVPPATPSSAMSISPANSEVGSRLINSNITNGGSQNSVSNSSTSSLTSRNSFNSKQRYSWGKSKKGLSDRADLEHNWAKNKLADRPDHDHNWVKNKHSERANLEQHWPKNKHTERADLDHTWAKNKHSDRTDLDHSWSKNKKNLPDRADNDHNWAKNKVVVLPDRVDHDHNWAKKVVGIPDRADLDHNWRASATGPASDKSSSSGASEGSTGGRRERPLEEGRADTDLNWRHHDTVTGPDLANGNMNSLPPSGAKNRKNQNTKSNIERGL